VWTRENVTDYRLILRTVTGLLEDALNTVNFTWSGNHSDYDAIVQICRQAKRPLVFQDLNIDAAATQKLSESKHPSRTFSGKPYTLINDIITQNKLFAWYDPSGGLNIRGSNPFERSANGGIPDHSYAPIGDPSAGSATVDVRIPIKQTLIDVPQLTQDGVLFKVLLDSDVKIGDLVQLSGTVLPTFQLQFIRERPPITAENGTYCVVGIRHVGDSRGRGGDWHTEIQGVARGFFASTLLAKTPL